MKAPIYVCTYIYIYTLILIYLLHPYRLELLSSTPGSPDPLVNGQHGAHVILSLPHSRHDMGSHTEKEYCLGSIHTPQGRPHMALCRLYPLSGTQQTMSFSGAPFGLLWSEMAANFRAGISYGLLFCASWNRACCFGVYGLGVSG